MINNVHTNKANWSSDGNSQKRQESDERELHICYIRKREVDIVEFERR